MNPREAARRILEERPEVVSSATRVLNRMRPDNHFRVPGSNVLLQDSALVQGTEIVVRGSNNSIRIGKRSRLRGCHITVSGNDNHIVIGEQCRFWGAELFIEDDGNVIEVGAGTTLNERTHLAAIEGHRISVGEDCLFSHDIRVVTGDSHSILDASGDRINPSADVMIARHVWVGARAMVLKGSSVAPHSVVGAGAIVTSQFTEEGCALAGIPARVVKRQISWDGRRLPLPDNNPSNPT